MQIQLQTVNNTKRLADLNSHTYRSAFERLVCERYVSIPTALSHRLKEGRPTAETFCHKNWNNIV